METAFRLYNNGEKLVVVCFPKNGGEALLRKSWSMDSVCLESNEVPNRRDMPFGVHKIPNRKSLVRGGFLIKINYQKERITVVPKTRQNNKLDSKSCVYRFEDLGVEHMPDKDDFNMSERKLKARLDRNPVSKD